MFQCIVQYTINSTGILYYNPLKKQNSNMFTGANEKIISNRTLLKRKITTTVNKLFSVQWLQNIVDLFNHMKQFESVSYVHVLVPRRSGVDSGMQRGCGNWGGGGFRQLSENQPCTESPNLQYTFKFWRLVPSSSWRSNLLQVLLPPPFSSVLDLPLQDNPNLCPKLCPAVLVDNGFC